MELQSALAGSVAGALSSAAEVELDLQAEQALSMELDETSSDSDDCDMEDSSDEEAGKTSNFVPQETIIVFDWDDTILPSTWLARQGLRLDGGVPLTAETRRQLRRVSRSAASAIKSAKRCGRVVLVTNAERGWIELTCHKFMPALRPLLESVNVISARSAYEGQGVVSPVEWKSRAFEAEIRNFYDPLRSDLRKNVISVGDSAHERRALLQVAKQMTNCCNKSLKFVEQPDLRQIQKEHELISHCIRHIVDHSGNLDLCIKFAP